MTEDRLPTAVDPPPAVDSPPPGGGVNISGGMLWKLARKILSGESEEERLRKVLLAHQIAQLQGKRIAAVHIDPEYAAVEERFDGIILGHRGSGKTAAAVYIAQEHKRLYDKPIYAYGWPKWAAAQINARPLARLDPDLRDCILLIDEAGLWIEPGRTSKPLRKILALARHTNTTILWTAQSLAGLSREALRHDARLYFRGADPVANAFDREEATELLATARTLHEPDDIAHTVIHESGRWFVTHLPLPDCWSDKLSKLWR